MRAGSAASSGRLRLLRGQLILAVNRRPPGGRGPGRSPASSVRSHRGVGTSARSPWTPARTTCQFRSHWSERPRRGVGKRRTGQPLRTTRRSVHPRSAPCGSPRTVRVPPVGEGAFYTTDGNGGIRRLRVNSGWPHDWTAIIPGNFGGDGHTDLLFYDRTAWISNGLRQQPTCAICSDRKRAPISCPWTPKLISTSRAFSSRISAMCWYRTGASTRGFDRGAD